MSRSFAGFSRCFRRRKVRLKLVVTGRAFDTHGKYSERELFFEPVNEKFMERDQNIVVDEVLLGNEMVCLGVGTRFPTDLDLGGAPFVGTGDRSRT